MRGVLPSVSDHGAFLRLAACHDERHVGAYPRTGRDGSPRPADRRSPGGVPRGDDVRALPGLLRGSSRPGKSARRSIASTARVLERGGALHCDFERRRVRGGFRERRPAWRCPARRRRTGALSRSWGPRFARAAQRRDLRCGTRSARPGALRRIPRGGHSPAGFWRWGGARCRPRSGAAEPVVGTSGRQRSAAARRAPRHPSG